MEAAFSRVGSSAFFRSATAEWMVMDMLVPVSPSGTGNTFSSLIDCLWISIEAAALMISLRKSAPLMVCLNGITPPKLGQAQCIKWDYPIIMESM